MTPATNQSEGKEVPFPSTKHKALPHSLEAEEYLLSCCFLDGAEVLAACESRGITEADFSDAKHGTIYEVARQLWRGGSLVDLATVAEELKTRKQLDEIGGYPFLIQVTSRIPTTAQAGFFISKVHDLHLLRETIRAANASIEECHNFTGDIDALLEGTRGRMARIGVSAPAIPAKGIFDFKVPRPGDHSILLGNRYLNRGDGGFLVSTSGMGKSSMALQMATLWACGSEAFGIKPNGPLRSLIVQAEDSEGDVGEVAQSIRAKLGFDDATAKIISDLVTVISMKTRKNFFAKLRAQIARHKPDIVWINPLQSFMQGDIKDSRDLGDFLRDGLGELNEAGDFAYMIVHHTTKPPAEKAERQWNEVMYDMAGGAEIINWSRLIISLRAESEEGKFKLVLAKRGRRAGAMKKVQQGAGFRSEITTSIKLRYSSESVVTDGMTIPMIFWEMDEERQDPVPVEKKTRAPVLAFLDVRSAIPVGKNNGATWHQIQRELVGKKKVSQAALADSLLQWSKDGQIQVDLSNPNRPLYYLDLD